MGTKKTKKQAMTEKEQASWKPYAITFAVGALMTLGVLSIDKAFSAQLPPLDRVRFLSDAFFVPGALIFCVGMMIFVSSKGSFDGLAYSLQFLKRELLRFLPSMRDKVETFADYKARKAEKKTPYRYLLVVGAVYLLFGFLFTMIFLVMESKAAGL